MKNLLSLLLLSFSMCCFSQLKFTFETDAILELAEKELIVDSVMLQINLDLGSNRAEIVTNGDTVVWRVKETKRVEESFLYDLDIILENSFGEIQYYRFLEQNITTYDVSENRYETENTIGIYWYDYVNSKDYFLMGEILTTNFIPTMYTEESNVIFRMDIESGTDDDNSIDFEALMNQEKPFVALYTNHDNDLFLGIIYPTSSMQTYGYIDMLGEKKIGDNKSFIMYNWTLRHNTDTVTEKSTVDFSSELKADNSYQLTVCMSNVNEPKIYFTGSTDINIEDILK